MKTFITAQIKNERLFVNGCEIDDAAGEPDGEGEIDIDVDYTIHDAEYDRRIRQEPLNIASVEIKEVIYKRVDGSEVNIIECLTDEQIENLENRCQVID